MIVQQAGKKNPGLENDDPQAAYIVDNIVEGEVKLEASLILCRLMLCETRHINGPFPESGVLMHKER